MSLDAQLVISRFQLLAGTKEVRIEGDRLIGRFSHNPVVVRNFVRFCEAFANATHSDRDILNFTRKYAPVALSVYPKPGAFFNYEVYEWTGAQVGFRNTWKEVATTTSSIDKGEKKIPLSQGSLLIFSSSGNTLQPERAIDLVDLAFGCLDLNRIRICPAPECRRRFFVATHLKQTYCGNTNCVEWGQRKLKREYWERNKEHYLEQRRLTRRER